MNASTRDSDPSDKRGVLGGAELRLAALLYPRLVVDDGTYRAVLDEIRLARRSDTLGPQETRFLEEFLVRLPVPDDEPPPGTEGEEDWPTPVGVFQVFQDWRAIDPDHPIWQGAFGAGEPATWSDWLDYACDDVPTVVFHRQLIDEEVRESTGAFQTLLEISLRDRDLVCAATWGDIVNWVQGGRAAAFRKRLQSALRAAEGDGADRASRAADILHREIMESGLRCPSELDDELTENRVETALGILVGFVPVIGPLFTAGLGATKEKKIRDERTKLQWIELISDIDSLRDRRS